MLVGKPGSSFGRLAMWSLRLHQHDITVLYKPAGNNGNAHYLPQAPVKLAPATSDNDDAFLGKVENAVIGQSQRNNLDIHAVMAHLENQGGNFSKGFLQTLADFCARDRVLHKKSFTAMGETWFHKHGFTNMFVVFPRSTVAGSSYLS